MASTSGKPGAAAAHRAHDLVDVDGLRGAVALADPHGRLRHHCRLGLSWLSACVPSCLPRGSGHSQRAFRARVLAGLRARERVGRSAARLLSPASQPRKGISAGSARRQAGDFVLAYRCGAAPDSDRVPFWPARPSPRVTSTGRNVTHCMVTGQLNIVGQSTRRPPHTVVSAAGARPAAPSKGRPLGATTTGWGPGSRCTRSRKPAGRAGRPRRRRSGRRRQRRHQPSPWAAGRRP